MGVPSLLFNILRIPILGTTEPYQGCAIYRTPPCLFLRYLFLRYASTSFVMETLTNWMCRIHVRASQTHVHCTDKIFNPGRREGLMAYIQYDESMVTWQCRHSCMHMCYVLCLFPENRFLRARANSILDTTNYKCMWMF